MKKSKSFKSTNGHAHACRAHFELVKPDAREVFLAGSFNNWQPATTRMAPAGDGLWKAEIELPAGRHEYRFIADGQWIDDPAASERVSNPFGGTNAVLSISQQASL